MFFDISWEILFRTEGQTYELRTVAEIDIDESVDNLADTATIVLPEAVLNQVLNLEGKIKRGSEVQIRLGYDGRLVDEFSGYVLDVPVNDSSLKITCEDGLFLFRVGVKNKEYKPTSVKALAQDLIAQIDRSFKLVCDYDIAYEKFTVHDATGYDVLKKIQEETKANIYFVTGKKELHIHPPYVEKFGEVHYSMQVNIESSSLEYKRAIDRKVEVVVESTDLKGKVHRETVGNSGGDKVTLKVGSVSAIDVKKIAESELKRRSADAYEGTFDGWLIPLVEPGYSAIVEDEDYPEKTGRYYVVGVKTNVSESGAKRTITLGVKLGNG